MNAQETDWTKHIHKIHFDCEICGAKLEPLTNWKYEDEKMKSWQKEYYEQLHTICPECDYEYRLKKYNDQCSCIGEPNENKECKFYSICPINISLLRRTKKGEPTMAERVAAKIDNENNEVK